MSNAQIIIGTLEELLAKPGGDPESRQIWQGRLDYWRDKAGSSNDRDHSRALAASMKSRQAKARDTRRKVMPYVLGLKGDGLTYAQIAAALEAKGFISLKGTPFSAAHVGSMARDYNRKGTRKGPR